MACSFIYICSNSNGSCSGRILGVVLVMVAVVVIVILG